MPAPALASMASKAGVSKGRAEQLWDKAKEVVSKGYKYGKKSSKHWALVMGTVKKMLGMKKEDISFSEYMHLEAAASISEQEVEVVALGFIGQALQGTEARDQTTNEFLDFVQQRKDKGAPPVKAVKQL